MRELVEEIGTKWSEIVEYLPGRTNNGVFEEAFNEVFKCRAELQQEHGKEPKTGYAAPALHSGAVLSGWQDGSCWVQSGTTPEDSR